MSPEEVKKRVAAIEAAMDDDEVAHGMEDELHQDVLHAISRGECEGCEMAVAKAALKTLKLDFSRWYA